MTRRPPRELCPPPRPGPPYVGRVPRSSTRLALAALLAAAPAAADPPPDTAHAGLMIRAALGFGYDAVRGDDSPLQLSGGAFGTHLAVGWYLVPNLALHGTIWNGLTFNPTGTSPAGRASVSRGNTPAVTGRGVGVTWVFAPLGAFVSASVGFSTIDLQTTVSDVVVIARADLGVGVDVMVGKQFEVSSGWRFGVGAQGFYHRNNVLSRGEREDVTSGGVTLLGTLTYH
ncbi:MAG: hypothetical protein JWM10_1427 [Myxococcaceae bacterium]|nr:hypothetical protein [Myxococcaceae bacterium]